jgi:hypothetical protein
MWSVSHVDNIQVMVVNFSSKMPASRNKVPVLRNYGIDTETGFVPNPAPLRRLPVEFEPWEKLMDDFTGFIMTGQLRDRIPIVLIFYVASFIIG